MVVSSIICQEVPSGPVEGFGKSAIINSEILGQSREIFIKEPYAFDSIQYYPLVVTLDGEMTFRPFAAIAELMGHMELIPHCLFISIPNVNRDLDYAPLIEGIPESGNADKMVAFYREELLPYLEDKYNISGKALYGHSYLGLFSTYVMLTDPGLFDCYISSSPSLRFITPTLRQDRLFEEIGNRELTYYLTTGSLEIANEAADLMQQRLKTDAPGNTRWHYINNPGRNHNTNAIISFMDGLTFWFKEAAEAAENKP